MAKVSFTPIIKWVTGAFDNVVFRRSHNGKVSIYPTPDMSSVKWSQAQKDHRQRMGEASRYASAAVADPDIRPICIQMAVDLNKNPKRPFDMPSTIITSMAMTCSGKSTWAIRRNQRTGTWAITPGIFINKSATVNVSHPDLFA